MEVEDPRPRDGELLVRGVRIGLCGTDHEINEGLYGTAPEGSAHLILGHESLGRVERGDGDVGAGTYVVGIVRRPDGCPNCARGEQDMCLWGKFTERGIVGLHGFGSEWWVEHPDRLVPIPEPLAEVGVLVEPTTIAEKAVRHAFAAQRRAFWEPTRALVAGAGPIGMLGAIVLRLRGLEVTVFERKAKPERKALLERAGARYAATSVVPLQELVAGQGPPDLAIEATGNAQVAFEIAPLLNANGVEVLTSVTGGDATATLGVAKLNQSLVLGNRMLLGSINAHRADFEQGVRDLAEAERRWPGLLASLITRRVPLAEAASAVPHDPTQIKTVVELG